MISRATAQSVRPAQLKLVSDLPPFRFRRIPSVPGKVLVVNELGNWLFLSDLEFQAFLEGRLDPASTTYRELGARHMLSGAPVDVLIEGYREKNRHLFVGPSLHIMAITLRCNQACHYCHSSKVGMNATDVDMSLQTARTIVDRIFESSSLALHIEFQGGEPLVHWDCIQFVVDYANQKNKYRERDVAFSVVTNLSLMTEERMQWLLDHGVMICTSLDGPKDLHETNRPFKAGGSSYDHTVRWIDTIHNEYERRGFDPKIARVNALLTVTRASLGRGRDIVDEYVRRGLKAVYLRSLDPFGFAAPLWGRLGYTAQQFLAFYCDTLDYLIDQNLRGAELIERLSATHLTKMLTPRDPNHMDYRSPCGAGIGQIAYNYDGRVYTCDEGRMVAEMGDPVFLVGDINQNSYDELVGSETVRSLTVASTLENIPYCNQCAYKTSCGVCPVYNYVTQGDLFGQMTSNGRCAMSMGVQDYLYARLHDDAQGRVREVFDRWTIDHGREMIFRQDGI